MEIKVEKPSQKFLDDRKVRSWGIWEKVKPLILTVALSLLEKYHGQP